MSPLFVALLAASGPLHLKVDGDGYLRFMNHGQPAYAREADLTVIGGLLGSHGATFLPAIRVPDSLSQLHIDLMGNVDIAGAPLGRLVLALPAVPGEPDSSGFVSFQNRPRLTNPGEDTAGVLRLEGEGAGSSLPSTAQKTAPKVTTKVQSTSGSTSAAGKPAAPKVVASKSGKLEILVHPHTLVGGEPVTLSQIATITGPAELVTKASDVVIANSPAIGIKRRLDEHTLTTLLQVAGIEPSKTLMVCPPGADVAQKSQTVTADTMLQSALAAVQAKFGGTIPLVASQKVLPLLAREGEVALETSEPEALGDGFFVTVTVRVAGDIAGTQSFSLVPSKDAPRIKQNDPVTVVLISGAATVEVAGRAKTGGYVGQRIEVIVEHVGNGPTAHVGTLVSLDRVEVQL